jgi:hypothetical protein
MSLLFGLRFPFVSEAIMHKTE